MKLLGLMVTRNEDWILGLSARAALRWVDGLVILDHASTDKTPEIIYEIMQENPGRVFPLVETDGTQWDEMDHRERTLLEARNQGATHIAIVDSDEVLISSLTTVIRSVIESLKPAQVLDMPMYTCWKSLDRYRNDASTWSHGIISLAFKDAPSIHWKSQKDGYQHHARIPSGMPWTRHTPFSRATGGVMHLQHSNWRRVRAKQYWYRIMESVRWPGRRKPEELNKIYNEALSETGIKLSPVPGAWWKGYIDLVDHVSLDGVPWHEGEIKRLWKENDPSIFDRIEIPGEIIDPKDRPLSSVLDAELCLWICKRCGILGATRYREIENNAEVVKRVHLQHSRTSECPASPAIFDLSNIRKDTILTKFTPDQ